MYNTNHTKIIIDFLNENKNKSFTAIELIDYFSGIINKATIYRKLLNLEENGLIRKSFNNIKNVYEYQYSIGCNNHMHLICTNCRKLEHLDCKEVNDFIGHILNVHKFNVNLATTIYGICKECGISD